MLQGTKLDVMQSYVLETILWYKEVIENYVFSCLYCMEQRICEI
jgi:hypothetical protein